jgi:glutamate carboxypeptidase
MNKNNLWEYVWSLEEEMFRLLEKLVLIQSGTFNKPGVDLMAETINGVLSDIPLTTEILPMKECGNMVLARTGRAAEEKPVLLVGHMDTVFPEDTGFNCYRQDREKAYGPGVMDMKGGLVVGIFALKALSGLGLLGNLPVTLFFNSEEETGSPYSRRFIEELAVESRAAFVLEGGGLESQVVVGRKGKIGFELLVAGRSGHAGCAGPDKPSAILEAAHKVIALEGLNSPPDILVNVGLIRGGMGPNSVAGNAGLGVDVRFSRSEDEQKIFDEIKKIASENNIRGTSSEIRISSSRPPMVSHPGIEELYSLVLEIARKYTLPLGRETRGGVSDANFIAALGVPVLDGLGPCGDLDHSDREYILKKTMVERTVLLAASLFEAGSRERGF